MEVTALGFEVQLWHQDTYCGGTEKYQYNRAADDVNSRASAIGVSESRGRAEPACWFLSAAY